VTRESLWVGVEAGLAVVPVAAIVPFIVLLFGRIIGDVRVGVGDDDVPETAGTASVTLLTTALLNQSEADLADRGEHLVGLGVVILLAFGVAELETQRLRRPAVVDAELLVGEWLDDVRDVLEGGVLLRQSVTQQITRSSGEDSGILALIVPRVDTSPDQQPIEGELVVVEDQVVVREASIRLAQQLTDGLQLGGVRRLNPHLQIVAAVASEVQIVLVEGERHLRQAKNEALTLTALAELVTELLAGLTAAAQFVARVEPTTPLVEAALEGRGEQLDARPHEVLELIPLFDPENRSQDDPDISPRPTVAQPRCGPHGSPHSNLGLHDLLLGFILAMYLPCTRLHGIVKPHLDQTVQLRRQLYPSVT